MNHIGSKSIFYIDSQNRLNTADTTSNFTVRVDMPPMNNYNRICVLQASIPKSFYLITDGKNTMTLNEPGTVGLASGSITSDFGSVSSNGTSSKTIKFNNGNYSKSALQNAVYDLFKKASSLNVNSAHRYIYNIAYPLSVFSTNGKFTYTVANLITAPPQLIFSSASVLHRPLGFNIGSTNTFSSLGSLSSSNVINLQAKDTIFIKSGVVSSSNLSVLQEIYSTTTPDFSCITFTQNNIEMNSKELMTNSNNFTFTITDEDNNVLDLNGQNIIFSICCYEQNNAMELLKQDILINNLNKLSV